MSGFPFLAREGDEEFAYAAFVNDGGGEFEAAEMDGLTAGGDGLEEGDEESAHGFDRGHGVQGGVFAAEVVDAHGAADAPATGAGFLHDEALGFAFAANFTDDFLKDVLERDEAGGAAEFIEDDGESTLLALEALEELKEVHARGDEGGKFNGLGEIDGGVVEESPGVEDADDGVGCAVVNGEAAVPEFAGGDEHVFDGEVVGDAGHLGAGTHDLANGAAIEADDFEYDVEFGAGEGALLDGEFEKFLIVLLGEAVLGADGAGDEGAEKRAVEALGDAAEGTDEPHEKPHRSGDTERPRIRCADGKGFGDDFANNKDEDDEESEGKGQRPLLEVEGHPEAEGDEGGVGEGVAQDDGGEEVLGFAEQLDDGGAAGRGFDFEAAGAGFAEGEEGGFGEGEETAQRGEDKHSQEGEDGGREGHERLAAWLRRLAGREGGWQVTAVWRVCGLPECERICLPDGGWLIGRVGTRGNRACFKSRLASKCDGGGLPVCRAGRLAVRRMTGGNGETGKADNWGCAGREGGRWQPRVRRHPL